jgi:polyhydroxybutyrate depolymerase
MSRRSFRCLFVAALAACDSAGSSSQPTDAPAGGSADAAVSSPDATACGIRTGQRGKTRRTITAGGLDRTYIVYLPDGADPTKPLPLVFVHHGYTMSAEAMFDLTGYPALADSEGIALAFPDGQGGPDSFDAPWNVGANVCPASGGSAPPNATGDDFAMLDAIKADIAVDQCIDDAHVYVTGFSMGGYFSHHAGCMRPDIKAVAPHSGGTHDLGSCASTHKPIIIFHGKADTIVPDYCDDPTQTPLFGVTPSAAAWAAKNGCAMTTHSQSVMGGTCRYYDGCPADGQVAICTFNAMGHCWAGGEGLSVYSCGTYESATALEWAFFKQYAW